MLEDEKLTNIEIEIKKQIYEEAEKKLKKYNIITTTIDKQKDIIKNVYKLLERRKNANIY